MPLFMYVVHCHLAKRCSCQDCSAADSDADTSDYGRVNGTRAIAGHPAKGGNFHWASSSVDGQVIDLELCSGVKCYIRIAGVLDANTKRSYFAGTVDVCNVRSV